MKDFDWYLSPADRFQYETDFSKYTTTERISLKQLDQLFQNSHISTNDFIQIWQLIDIKFEQLISKQQFVYFMHLLTSKRRGFDVPISMPLNIKQELLEDSKAKDDKLFVRRVDTSRDVGKSLQKSTAELQAEDQELKLTVDSKLRELELLKSRYESNDTALKELKEFKAYLEKKLFDVGDLEALQNDHQRLLSINK